MKAGAAFLRHEVRVRQWLATHRLAARIVGTVGLVWAATTLPGCTAKPKETIPIYPATQPTAVVATIYERSRALRSASGRGSVVLSSAKRGSVRLEALFVLAPPDRARVRAFKFNQAVFDLTVKPQGVWLFSPRDPDAENSSANVGAGIRDWLAYLGAGVPEGSMLKSATERIMNLKAPTNTGTLTTTVDRPTRTVRRYRLVDAAGVERFTLSLDNYRDFAGTLWPTRIEARSATGTIIVETDELRPHVAPATAFNPPPRAKRLP